jgi:acyl carrier protein
VLGIEEYWLRLGTIIGLPPINPIVPSLSLEGDIGVDSLQSLEVIIVTEQMAGVWIPPAVQPEIFTVADAYSYYVECYSRRDSEAW